MGGRGRRWEEEGGGGKKGRGRRGGRGEEWEGGEGRRGKGGGRAGKEAKAPAGAGRSPGGAPDAGPGCRASCSSARLSPPPSLSPVLSFSPPACPPPSLPVQPLSLPHRLSRHLPEEVSVLPHLSLSVRLPPSCRLKPWHLWSPGPVSLSLCFCLSAPSPQTNGSMSVHPSIGLRQLQTPPCPSLIDCSSVIPFEYCSSRLMVRKGTGQEKRGWGEEPSGVLSASLFPSSLAPSLSSMKKRGDSLKRFFSNPHMKNGS